MAREAAPFLFTYCTAASAPSRISGIETAAPPSVDTKPIVTGVPVAGLSGRAVVEPIDLLLLSESLLHAVAPSPASSTRLPATARARR